MPKYKEGDKFDCQLEILEVVEDEDETMFSLAIVGTEVWTTDEEGWFSTKMLDEAFDPHYKERKKLERIRELEEELEELKSESK